MPQKSDRCVFNNLISKLLLIAGLMTTAYTFALIIALVRSTTP